MLESWRKQQTSERAHICLDPVCKLQKCLG